MHSSFRPLPACLAALLVLVLGIPMALPAEAGDGKAAATPAVEQLKPDELAFLKKKFPEWDKVDARRKEHIARNVIRLRNMSPEERKKLKGRVDRLRRGHKGHGKGRHGSSQMFRVADEIGARLIEGLPVGVRTELTKLDVRPSMARMAVFRMLKSKAAAAVSIELTEAELARLSDRSRQRVQEMMASAKGDPKKLAGVRARVQRMLAWGLMTGLHKRLKAESGGKEVPATALAEGLMQEWKPAVEELVAEITADPKLLLSAVQRAERDYMSKADYTKSIWALERLALGKWRRDPQAQAAAAGVVRRLLIDELRIDGKAVNALPGYDAGRERRAALSKLIGTRGGEQGAGSSRRGGKGTRRKPGPNGAPRRGQGRRGPRSGKPKEGDK